MSNGPMVVQCAACGKLYRENARGMCLDCLTREDEQIALIERHLRRNRQLNNEQVAELAAVPPEKIRSWIRKGKIKLYDYPNLADACDLCSAPIRQGKLCGSCSSRIQSDIAHTLEQERLMKERLKRSHSYISKR